MLARSLKADGKFEFAERPGTVFGDGDDSTPEKRKGFLVTITQDWVVKAKAYIVITDPLAGVDFKGGLTENTEPEYGARWKFLGKGPGELDLQPTFLSVGVEADKQYDWEIIHGGREGFFGKWASFNVSVGDTNIIFHNGEKLAQADNDFVKKITAKSEGLYWFCKGICIDVPENFPEDFAYVKADGTSVPRGKRIMDFGGPNPGEVSTSTHSPGYGWSTKYTWDRVAEFGVSITKDGVLKFTEAYGGHGLRLTLGAQFEYFYGARYLGFNGNQFGFFFFNRRISPEGATMPSGL
jgi:hypothetical protein